MLWIREDINNTALFYHTAIFHDCYLITYFLHYSHFMSN